MELRLMTLPPLGAEPFDGLLDGKYRTEYVDVVVEVKAWDES
jgi:hypothetical protein